jgi:hypothetical protein
MIRKLWTDETPKTSGYYWLKTEDAAEVVRVWRGRVYSTQGGGLNIAGVRAEDVQGKWSAAIPFPQMRVVNKHEQGLKDLTLAVIDCLAALDYAMEKRDSPERGQTVARIANALGVANERAMHFSLGMEFEAINTLKRKRERERIKARKAQAGRSPAPPHTR